MDDPQVTPVGLFDDDEDDDLIHEIAADIRDAVDNAAAERDLDDEDIREITTRAVRRATKASMAKKPLMTVHVVRV